MIERPVDGAEEPAQSWVDLTGTLDGGPRASRSSAPTKHGWDVSPAGSAGLDVPSIGITAVRSPVYSWHDPRLLDPEGVYSFQDQGIQQFRVELIPHSGDWRTAQPTRRAAVLGQPVRAQLESFHEGALPARHSFADDGGEAVLVTAIKGSEDAAARRSRRMSSSARSRPAASPPAPRCDCPSSSRTLTARLRAVPGAHLPRAR